MSFIFSNAPIAQNTVQLHRTYVACSFIFGNRIIHKQVICYLLSRQNKFYLGSGVRKKDVMPRMKLVFTELDLQSWILSLGIRF